MQTSTRTSTSNIHLVKITKKPVEIEGEDTEVIATINDLSLVETAIRHDVDNNWCIKPDGEYQIVKDEYGVYTIEVDGEEYDSNYGYIVESNIPHFSN